MNDDINADMRSLSTKLLETLHLNVPERQKLPGGGIPFSEMVAGVGQRLANDGWFPIRLTPETVIGQGATIELRNGKIWVHEQHELGVARYSEIESSQVRSVSDAVRILIRAVGGPPIDGVPVDWSR